MHADVDVAYAELRTSARRTAAVTLVNGSDQSAGFSCCTNTTKPILWHFTRPHDNSLHVVYNGHSLHPALLSTFDVRFDSSIGCSYLRIKQARFGDAGTYCCLESNSARRKLCFELVVLGQCIQRFKQWIVSNTM